MESFIKSLSKIPSSILSILAFVLCVLVFYESILLVDLMLSYVELVPIRLLLFFSIVILPTYGTYRLMKWTRKAIDQSIKDSNSSLVADTDIPALCLEMLEAVQQKHRYTNYEAKLETYSDWMAFQVDKGNHKMMGDVVEGMNPTKLEEIIKNSFVASEFEGQRGAYDKTINEDDKKLVQSMIVTFDNVFIARNKFLDWLLNHNRFNSWFFNSYAFIEIALITQINLMKDVFDHKEIRVKINTKAMALRGAGEIAELRFTLDDEDKPSYEEIFMMDTPFFSFTEKEMEDSNTAEVIKFMQKFIKNTRKLIRKV